MPEAIIAASHYEPDGPGDGRKILQNYYAETNPQDPGRTNRIIRTPGSRIILDDTDLTTGARGIAQADGFAGGKLVIVDGTTVRLMDIVAETLTALTGSVAGTSQCDVVFSELQAAFLSDGDLFVSDGSSVAAATDADWATLLSDYGETGFSSIDTLGQRLVASYGNRWAFSDVLDFNETTTLSYYTAESAPDGIVCLKRVGNILYVIGTQTIEAWMQTGNNDDPFRRVDPVMQRGCMAKNSVVALDNTLFFIGDDRAVYRLNSFVPQMVNPKDNWVSRHLESTDPADVYCDKYEVDSHSFYIIRTPDLCIAYDLSTNTWHKRKSRDTDTWNWLNHIRVGAKHYARKADGLALVELSRDYLSDEQADASTFGKEILRAFTAHAPVKVGREKLAIISLDGSKGVGLVTGQGQDPQVRMSISKDKGRTFGNKRARSLGPLGEYARRTIWRRNGRAAPEQFVAKFEVSDPVDHFFTRVAINEQ